MILTLTNNCLDPIKETANNVENKESDIDSLKKGLSSLKRDVEEIKKLLPTKEECKHHSVMLKGEQHIP